MAGLMAKRMQDPAAAEGREPMGGNGADPAGPNGQRRKATPEEQHLHDEFIGNAVNALYQEDTAASVVNMLENTEGPPAQTLSNIITMIVSSVKASAEQNGVEVPDAIVSRAAAKIASEVVTELAPSAGLPEIDQEQMHGAYYNAMETLGEQRRAGAAQVEEDPGPAAPPARRGNGLMPGMDMARRG